jgi:hypothetical protein
MIRAENGDGHDRDAIPSTCERRFRGNRPNAATGICGHSRARSVSVKPPRATPPWCHPPQRAGHHQPFDLIFNGA